MDTCALEGCSRPAAVKGLCKSCYSNEWQKAKRAATARPVVCDFCGTEFEPIRANGRNRFCSRQCKSLGRAGDPELQRRALDGYYRRRYGLSLDEATALKSRGCAICGRTEVPGRWANNMHIDHCHETGRVRGVLCHGCNVALGSFHHDPVRLRAAADYLERRVT